MTIEFSVYEYVKFYKGNGQLCCHVDAQHAKGPQADLFTGRIAENLMKNTNCAGIIGTISRTVADLNRKPDGQNDDALKQYRRAIKEILNHIGILNEKETKATKPYLHLTLHGMKDVHHGPYAIEIGTFHGMSCSDEVREWLHELLITKTKDIMPEITIVFDQVFDGDESIIFHRLGDGDAYSGYGPNFHTFQFEISRTLRENHSSEIVNLLSHIILNFQTQFVDPH